MQWQEHYPFAGEDFVPQQDVDPVVQDALDEVEDQILYEDLWAGTEIVEEPQVQAPASVSPWDDVDEDEAAEILAACDTAGPAATRFESV